MAQSSKVHYRPIEAAIRWSGLVRHEGYILEVLNNKRIPDPDAFPRWPCLRLNAERIDDAIVHKELPCEVNGITLQDGIDINHPDLTIRHVDLKAWMKHYYPEQRPSFLFSRIERKTHPIISLEDVQLLMFEREALRIKINQRETIKNLRSGAALPEASGQEPGARTNTITGKVPGEAPSLRNETTYLHIVGGLLTLLLGQSPSGKPYSNFRTQEAIIDALMAHHSGRLGITERTLQAKFAEARRRLSPS